MIYNTRPDGICDNEKCRGDMYINVIENMSSHQEFSALWVATDIKSDIENSVNLILSYFLQNRSSSLKFPLIVSQNIAKEYLPNIAGKSSMKQGTVQSYNCRSIFSESINNRLLDIIFDLKLELRLWLGLQLSLCKLYSALANGKLKSDKNLV